MIIKEKRKIELELTKEETLTIQKTIGLVDLLDDELDRYGLLTQDIDEVLSECRHNLYKLAEIIAHGIVADFESGGTDE